MDSIILFFANPIVGIIGFVVSFIASIISIVQYLGKSKAEEEVRTLRIAINRIQQTTNNTNKVHQGNKSQYFQENSGSINIDNRN